MYCVSLNYKLAGCLAFRLQRSTPSQLKQCLLSTLKVLTTVNYEMTIWIIQIVFVNHSTGSLHRLLGLMPTQEEQYFTRKCSNDLHSNKITLSSDLLWYPHRHVFREVKVLTYSTGCLRNRFPHVCREPMCIHSGIKISITFQRTKYLTVVTAIAQ